MFVEPLACIITATLLGLSFICVRFPLHNAIKVIIFRHCENVQKLRWLTSCIIVCFKFSRIKKVV